MEKIYKGNSSKLSGVYKLTNKINSRIYIGSCKRFQTRWHQHQKQLETGKHTNGFLQADYNKCGSSAFIFEVIEIIEGDKQLRLDAEQLLLDQFWDDGCQCYNLTRFAQSPEGNPFSNTPEETRQKMSKAQKGRKHTEETKKKLSLLHKGKKLSDETKEKIRQINKGKKLSDETKEKISKANKEKGGHAHTEETKKKLSEINKGRKHNEETKQKISNANKGENHPLYGKKASPETIKKLSESHKGHPGYWKGKKRGPMSEETKEKIRQTSKKRNTSKYNLESVQCQQLEHD